MVDILDEVLSDEKHEKRLYLFRKILPFIITFSLIIAFIIAGYGWYKNRNSKHNQNIGDLLVNLVLENSKDVSLSTKSLEELSIKSENRQAELAQIQLVNNYLASKNPGVAKTKLIEIINNNSYLELTRSYARIMWLSLVLAEVDLSDEDKNRTKIFLDHFDNENLVFFGTATIMKSLYYKKIGQIELARHYAEQLVKSPSTPLVIKEQASALLANLRD